MDIGTVIALIKALGGSGGGGGSATVVEVTGSDPQIVGVDNTRYVCGEVDTISITPPDTGIIDVIFISGSSKAVVTLPDTVMMPEWYDIESDRIYEINIMDGVYGSVMSWPV